MQAPNLTKPDLNTGDDAANSTTTGRYLVVLREDALKEGVSFVNEQGFDVFVSNTEDPRKEDQVGPANAIALSTLKVVLVQGPPDQISRLQDAAGGSGPILFVEPEKSRHLSPYDRPEPERLVELEPEKASPGFVDKPEATPDETLSTWGLQATRVIDSKFSGAGVRVAILDTGIALEIDANGDVRYHRDFAGRRIVTKSFVRGIATAKDGNGHGTHCIGTACGSRQPFVLPRYGIAYNSEIYAAKVVNDAGEAADWWAIQGIEWALRNRCQVVSMSLAGSPKKPGDPFNKCFEEIARRALSAGTIIVAAAGNDSGRPNDVLPITGPADCPSVIAVTALDHSLELWYGCNAGINPNGGEINFAAPGVKIYSSYVMPEYKTKSGTSMATPYVAGIAALYAEANPGVVGQALWALMKSRVSPLPLPLKDVGSGFIQAP